MIRSLSLGGEELIGTTGPGGRATVDKAEFGYASDDCGSLRFELTYPGFDVNYGRTVWVETLQVL